MLAKRAAIYIEPLQWQIQLDRFDVDSEYDEEHFAALALEQESHCMGLSAHAPQFGALAPGAAIGIPSTVLCPWPGNGKLDNRIQFGICVIFIPVTPAVAYTQRGAKELKTVTRCKVCPGAGRRGNIQRCLS